ncbi:MAG: helix-turn-helix domain-containing protein [Candidatus Microthrix sp.]|nr:helix-turn-helix domain-containing protein [Candidatus Microthrix sp.]
MVELIGRLGDGPEVGMVAVARLREMLDQERLVQVGGARRAGWSWAAVGAAFGVSRQSVHRMFAWLV